MSSLLVSLDIFEYCCLFYHLEMSSDIRNIIPDEVDMVLGLIYVGGGSGLSRIAPEGQQGDI